jgi:hypothetical protein
MVESGTSDLSPDEVKRRIPALKLIADPDLREATREVTATAPEYFWIVPASTSGFHHPLCRGRHGLWAHTLMVSTALERLVDSYIEQGLLTPKQADMARAAVILHDQRKNGHPGAPSTSSVSDHDLQMASVLRDHGGFPDPVIEAVETHMGPWYDGPEPVAPIERLVHSADMVASTSTITVKAPGPVPDELEKIGVEEGNI